MRHAAVDVAVAHRLDEPVAHHPVAQDDKRFHSHAQAATASASRLDRRDAPERLPDGAHTRTR